VQLSRRALRTSLVFLLRERQGLGGVRASIRRARKRAYALA
jgi:hypothetical protein